MNASFIESLQMLEGAVKQLLLHEVLKQEVLSQLHDYQGHQGID